MLPELLISKLRILYLHSRRRYLINSIPLLSIVALLVGFSISIMVNLFGSFSVFGLFGWLNGECFAATETIGDSTASMTLDTSDVVVNVVPGETGYASKSITVSTNNTESYALIITAPAVLKNESSNSTNPWSYAYGQSGELSTMSYTNFDGNTKELESGIESSGSTKTLAFSSTFAEGLASGHYKAEVTLGLVSTPKSTTAKWSNGVDSGIEYMQDITPGTGEGEFCKSSLPNHASIALKDKRDENRYTIVKMADGRCWMTENLRIMGGRTLTSADSDVSSNWALPVSNISGFNNNTIVSAYLGADQNNTATGYYTWCAATAGSAGGCKYSDGTSASSSNTVVYDDNATSSICPNGWKLPTGDYGGEFRTFADAEGISNDAAGSTKVQGPPYNFAYTGQMSDGSLGNASSEGLWWSSYADDFPLAYPFFITQNSVYPATGDIASNSSGCAVRCIADDSYTYSISYQYGNGYVQHGTIALPETQSVTSKNTSQSLTISSNTPNVAGGGTCFGPLTSWEGDDGVIYNPGATVTLTSSKPHLTLTTKSATLNRCY